MHSPRRLWRLCGVSPPQFALKPIAFSNSWGSRTLWWSKEKKRDDVVRLLSLPRTQGQCWTDCDISQKSSAGLQSFIWNATSSKSLTRSVKPASTDNLYLGFAEAVRLFFCLIDALALRHDSLSELEFRRLGLALQPADRHHAQQTLRTRASEMCARDTAAPPPRQPHKHSKRWGQGERTKKWHCTLHAVNWLKERNEYQNFLLHIQCSLIMFMFCGATWQE